MLVQFHEFSVKSSSSVDEYFREKSEVRSHEWEGFKAMVFMKEEVSEGHSDTPCATTILGTAIAAKNLESMKWQSESTLHQRP